MHLPSPPPKMRVLQGMEGIRAELVTYRPSRLGQVAALLFLSVGLWLLWMALPSAALLMVIFAALIYLLSGTITGPTVTIEITPLVLKVTLRGETESWPLEELVDIEEERWSALERRMGQIRFSVADGVRTVGGGNRWEEIRWLGEVLRRMAEARRQQIASEDPEARMAVRPPSAILEMMKR